MSIDVVCDERFYGEKVEKVRYRMCVVRCLYTLFYLCVCLELHACNDGYSRNEKEEGVVCIDDTNAVEYRIFAIENDQAGDQKGSTPTKRRFNNE